MIQPTDPARPRQAPEGASSRPGEDKRGGRRRVPTGQDLLRLAHQLQPRDQVIAALLVEHRVLTTSQLAAVLFGSLSAARTRLYRLRARHWVVSFTPVRPGGRVETLWVAGPVAARYVAAQDGIPPPTPRAWRDRAEAIAASAHLTHTVGANQVFVDLLAHARTHPGARLARWWGPVRTAAATGQRVHPDGHGVWAQGGCQIGFWLEYDTGTEPLHRLVAKIDPYARLRRIGGPDYPVLFHLPNQTREANLHRQLAECEDRLLTTVATTTPATVGGTEAGLAGPVWLTGADDERQRLIDLPGTPGRPGPYHPGPPTLDQDPLRLLGFG